MDCFQLTALSFMIVNRSSWVGTSIAGKLDSGNVSKLNEESLQNSVIMV